MPRPIDLSALKARSAASLGIIIARYDGAVAANLNYILVRWIAKMSAVEIHGIWERYAESRLVAALNHYPQHFIAEHSVRGVTKIPAGLSSFLVKGGSKYFDFRSTADLIDKADRLVGAGQNPFRRIPTGTRHYLDTLTAIRNYVVHGSETSLRSYKRTLREHYGIHSAPGPDEFLNAKDFRPTSPARNYSRLRGLNTIVLQAIIQT